ncbi:uncharacterized protein Dwil_GK24840 [Drosophila willistoni]|uniref:FAD dependent oxidoreductase domain-containing protein n=1 Tax=Drosophila willistoni TaxID=7260 RepID=B4N0X8_DROWI|nr:FAD-dependent oxidoreductase domain-containing protein 1 [Drosophila willistoni]EDW78140.1 uncharacterized protein Dwil_GK24840 [Drosophila willistoni]
MLRYRHVINLLQRRPYTAVPPLPPGSSNGNNSSDPEDNHPIRRTLRILGNDMRKVRDFFVPKEPIQEDVSERIVVKSKFKFDGDKSKGRDRKVDDFQTHCDVLVVGGGGVGSSIAYWLKEKARDGLNVVVVEKDDTYTKSSIPVSIGGMCQQFSLPENIQMSLFAADFMRNSREHFGTEIPLNYSPHGHLILASTAEEAERLRQTSQIQNEFGARNELLSPERLAMRFPWLNTQGITLASHGLEKEGSFDSWSLLANFRRQATGHGAHFVQGEVVDFLFKKDSDIVVVGDESSSYNGLDKAVIQMADGSQRSVKFALCVIAAGSNSGQVARLAKIGVGSGMLRIPLPIESRKRNMFILSTQEQNAPGMAMPMIVDSSETFVRRHGLCGHYICGHNGGQLSQEPVDQPSNTEYFEKHVKPILSQRIPSLDSATIENSWSGYFDYNVYDDNGIIGPHPYYNNLYVAAGFSGHGIQQSLAVGRAISELIMDGQYRTIDLSRLSFDRLIVDQPIYELNNVLS